MRVLTVSHFYEAHGGGIERVAGHLCRQFAAAGHEAVWAASDADALPAGPVTALALRCINPTEALTGLPMPIPGWRGLRALYREVGRSDIVVIHDSLYVTSICAMLAARAQRRKVVLIQHIAGIAFSSIVLRAAMALANLLVTRPMLRTADRLVFISDTVRRELLGDPARRDYRLVFNGVDGALFYPPAAPPPNGPVLFVGRYVEKKGLAVIRALAHAAPRSAHSPGRQRPDCAVGLGPGQCPRSRAADACRAGGLIPISFVPAVNASTAGHSWWRCLSLEGDFLGNLWHQGYSSAILMVLRYPGYIAFCATYPGASLWSVAACLSGPL